MTHRKQEQRFFALMENYQDLVFSVCFRMTGDYFASQDLAQETWLSAWRALLAERFDGENEKAWLCRIASNKCIDYLRIKRRFPVLMETADEERTDAGAVSVRGRIIQTLPDSAGDGDPERQALDAALIEELRARCRGLGPPLAAPAERYFCGGETAREIARVLGSKEKTVETQIRRAREKLKLLYRKDFGDRAGGRKTDAERRVKA